MLLKNYDVKTFFTSNIIKKNLNHWTSTLLQVTTGEM